MSDKSGFSTFSTRIKELRNALLPIVKDISEDVTIAIIGSVPLIGPTLAADRNTLRRLSALFETDDEIQRDIDKVVANMTETEEIMVRLKTHIEGRKNDLQQTLDEYNRFRGLASIEKEKAQPLLNELRREGNKGLIWGILTNILMVILGIILAHYLRIWYPDFVF
jgi:hypothetical protein